MSYGSLVSTLTFYSLYFTLMLGIGQLLGERLLKELKEKHKDQWPTYAPFIGVLLIGIPLLPVIFCLIGSVDALNNSYHHLNEIKTIAANHVRPHFPYLRWFFYTYIFTTLIIYALWVLQWLQLSPTPPPNSPPPPPLPNGKSNRP
ncbi:MAG: hypothetical protein NTW14_00735 [bacterium]|nr:hypothetical protein [bacterium]